MDPSHLHLHLTQPPLRPLPLFLSSSIDLNLSPFSIGNHSLPAKTVDSLGQLRFTLLAASPIFKCSQLRQGIYVAAVNELHEAAPLLGRPLLVILQRPAPDPRQQFKTFQNLYTSSLLSQRDSRFKFAHSREEAI